MLLVVFLQFRLQALCIAPFDFCVHALPTPLGVGLVFATDLAGLVFTRGTFPICQFVFVSWQLQAAWAILFA